MLLTKTMNRMFFGISFAVWLLLLVLGTYDKEDIFHSLYSVGGFFGGIGSGPWSFSLTRTFWGIPVLDLGLVGGFRLPYQGSLHSGILWPLRTVVPSVVIAFLYLLMSLLLATHAFLLCAGSWLRADWSKIAKARYVSLCVACWLILNYPLVEYLLSEDWYTVALPYTGFLTTVFALSRSELLRGEELPLHVLRDCLRLLLAGCYFLLLGHFSTIAVFVWLPVLLILWQFLGLSRSICLHWRQLTFEAALSCIILVRLCAVLVDIGLEFRGASVPRPLGDWWASPLQGVGTFKHFVGQFISSENSWLLRKLVPEFLPRFNIPAVGLGRLALSAFLLIFSALIVVCSRTVHERRVRLWLWTIVALYFWQFSAMTQVVPDLIRVSADYQWRDSLIVIGVLASVTSMPFLLGASAVGQAKLRGPFSMWIVLIAAHYALTTVFAPLTIVSSRTQTGQSVVSPNSAFGSTTRDDDWSGSFRSLAQSDFPLIVLVNSKIPLFPDVVEKMSDNWQGLTGPHQLRQIGVRSWEGLPKLRSSKHLNGDVVPSRLTWLSFELCNPEMATLLRIDKILISPKDLGECLEHLGSSSAASVPVITVDANGLQSAGLVVVSLRYRGMFAVTPTESPQDGSICGVVTDRNCLGSFGQRDDIIGVGPAICTGRCLMEVDLSSRQTNQQDRRVLLFPLNAQLPHKIVDVGTGREFSSLTIGGFIGLPFRDVAGHQLRVEFRPDARMFLHAFSGWSHLLIATPWLFGFLSRWRSSYETRRNARTREMTTNS